MLGYEVFQLLSPHLLPFLLILDVIIVFYDLLARFPVQLDDIRHVLALSLELNFLLADQTLLGLLLFVNVLFTGTNKLLGIAIFLFGLLVEVVSHPQHFLNHEVPMSFTLLGLS